MLAASKAASTVIDAAKAIEVSRWVLYGIHTWRNNFNKVLLFF